MNTGLNKEITRKIIAVAKACFPNAKVYLFGSRATGKFTDSSDIDIAIDASSEQRRADIGEVRDMLNASDIVHKVDVLDFHGVSQAMRDKILEEGILWAE